MLLLFAGPQYSAGSGTTNIALEGQWNAFKCCSQLPTGDSYIDKRLHETLFVGWFSSSLCVLRHIWYLFAKYSRITLKMVYLFIYFSTRSRPFRTFRHWREWARHSTVYQSHPKWVFFSTSRRWPERKSLLNNECDLCVCFAFIEGSSRGTNPRRVVGKKIKKIRRGRKKWDPHLF